MQDYYSQEELKKLHWKERWEYEARLERERLGSLTEEELLEMVQTGATGLYYQLWDVLSEKGSLEKAAQVLWEFLHRHPGKANMLHRYHCSAALFAILGMPDPDCKNELRKKVQWDLEGEEERQSALTDLQRIIAEKTENL
ncbi:MAG: hypothetical protein JXA25_14190 [Anaerolineales bacterium]|nr:hypothetical protein [Anaerolineales bacterium]